MIFTETKYNQNWYYKVLFIVKLWSIETLYTPPKTVL